MATNARKKIIFISWGNFLSCSLFIQTPGSLMFNDYKEFTTDQFIVDENFQDWVINPGSEHGEFWESFMRSHPEKAQEMAKAIAFIKNLHFSNEYPSLVKVEESLQNNLQRIALLESGDENAPRLLSSRRKKWLYPLAAILVAVLTLAGWHFYINEPVTIEILTGLHEKKSLFLPDSSRIILNENSRLRYPANLNEAGHRQVWLDGEAFFDIVHKEDKNGESLFTVHSGEVDVEVLGTSFNVNNKTEFTNVTLNHGSIRVSITSDPSSSFFLTPGEFMQYQPSRKKVLKKQVRPELYSLWKEEKLKLNNMPLSEIAVLIEDTYGYKVKFSDNNIKDSRISGTLRTENEEALMETISVALDIEIIKQDSMLLFHSKTKTAK